MMIVSRNFVLGGAAIAALAGLAACGPAAPPPRAAPPPPRPTIVIPPRPTPPNGASPNFTVPPTDASGLRQSVNRGISPGQTTWNFRSGFNVAALDCNAPKYAEIIPAYRSFLTRHSRGLRAANARVDAEFRTKHGPRFVVQREAYMTQVYNHFALPPTLDHFCDAALAVSQESRIIKPAELDAFAARSLPSLEVVFDDFYRRYDQYRIELSAWDAKYATMVSPASPAR
jgi:hypothetical protein